jgi:hypothetical protein
MMKRTLRTLSIVAIAALGFSACKKSKDDKSRTELLTQANWKVVAIQERSSLTAPWGPNEHLTAPNCEKDNFITFKTPNTGELNEGPTKCSAGDPQIETFTWAFTDGEKKLNIDGDISTITTLDEGTLIIQNEFSFGGTTFYTQTTLSH